MSCVIAIQYTVPYVFYCKQKTSYEMRISDWSSDVCSSDLKVIEFNNVSKSFGDRLLIDNLSFIAPPGAIIGIIGPNGAGKSTLFKMITGQEKPDSGSIDMGPTVNIAYVDQSREKLEGN